MKHGAVVVDSDPIEMCVGIASILNVQSFENVDLQKVFFKKPESIGHSKEGLLVLRKIYFKNLR